jgi:hypothetical protein
MSKIFLLWENGSGENRSLPPSNLDCGPSTPRERRRRSSAEAAGIGEVEMADTLTRSTDPRTRSMTSGSEAPELGDPAPWVGLHEGGGLPSQDTLPGAASAPRAGPALPGVSNQAVDGKLCTGTQFMAAGAGFCLVGPSNSQGFPRNGWGSIPRPPTWLISAGRDRIGPHLGSLSRALEGCYRR